MTTLYVLTFLAGGVVGYFVGLWDAYYEVRKILKEKGRNRSQL